MDILKIFALIFGLGILWFAWLGAKDTARTLGPKIKAWWAGEQPKLLAEFADLKARLAALEAKVGI